MIFTTQMYKKTFFLHFVITYGIPLIGPLLTSNTIFHVAKPKKIAFSPSKFHALPKDFRILLHMFVILKLYQYL